MTTKSDHDKNDRVILLLDMDCFYAQCETIRLGLDQSMPLCLMQWNSALAVNYTAREFGIKRGATFEEIRQMSGGQCVALHLPVISAVGEQSSFGDGDVDPTSGYSNTSTPTTAAAAAPTDDNGATDSTGGRNSSSTTTTSNDPTKSP